MVLRARILCALGVGMLCWSCVDGSTRSDTLDAPRTDASGQRAAAAPGESAKPGATVPPATSELSPGDGVADPGAADGAVAFGPAEQAASRACAERRAAVAKLPEVAGAPGFEAHRVELVGRVRGTPVLWRRAPRIAEQADARAAWEELAKAKRPLFVVKNLLAKHARRPERLRELLLREGYVYAEEPEIGLALVDMLRLTQLFREPTIFLFRGGVLHKLERQPRQRFAPERYVHAGGPLAGRPAELLLADRVGLDAAVADEPLTVDLLEAQRSDGFEQIRPTRMTERALCAELRYGGEWLGALFDLEAGRASLACLETSAVQAHTRAEQIGDSEPWRRALAIIRETVRDAVEEEPVFDEPWDEAEGEQQDGMLRREWKRAYLAGKRRYQVGTRSYEVYDPSGRPVPPQVCVDFITDTWERASGSWWAPLEPPGPGQKVGSTKPKRLEGGILFGKHDDMDNVRSVVELVRFAAKHQDMFEVWNVPEAERIPFRDRARFFAYLAEHPDRFRVGDVYVVFGVKNGHPHYHTMMIVEADPVTGVTTLIASNAVRPREQTLDGIMRISPGRTIKHVIRPNHAFFAKAILEAHP